ncbi:MAG: hypothetical protein ND895_27300 [Pyrinomonadaceae bacterium]|nr:hypothetical protein [Pyrinomonadaceae bacterium]
MGGRSTAALDGFPLHIIMSGSFDEMMRRTRGNLEVLHKRLLALGYRFSNPESALLEPDAEVEASIAFLEENIGKVPLALSSFYRVVGCVDFTGGHPEWEGCEYPDPIVVDPVAYSVSEAQEFLELESPNDYTISNSGIFRIPIAPDYYHKEDVSGGLWYGIEVPNENEDPELLEEWHHTTFVGYLRLCFEWGGFPGLGRDETRHSWPLATLKEGLDAI